MFMQHFSTTSQHFQRAFRLLHSRLLLVLSLGVVLSASCNEQTDERPIGSPGNVRSVPFDAPSEFRTRKIDIRRTDIDEDGFEDALVMVYPQDSLGARIGFETLRIYEYDSLAKQFTSGFEGKYFYGKMIDVRDLNRDGMPELCIRTDGGGNSPVASIGMTVLGKNPAAKKNAGKPSYIALAAFDFGNPEIITLSGDSTLALLGNDEYFPEYLSPSEAVIVPDSLVVFASPERAAALRTEYFTQAAQKAEERYTQAKTTVGGNRSTPALLAAYSEAVVTMRLLAKLPNQQRLQGFITKERPFWRSTLPKRLHDALDDVFRTRP
jgi:hypothetical protein